MAKRLTLRAALRKIEAQSRGFYWLSREGWINMLAREALGLPLTAEERDALKRSKVLDQK